MFAVAFKYCFYGQYVASPAVSQIVIAVPLTVVAFTFEQLDTQDALDLCMKFGEVQEEHRYAAGVPRLVACNPNGRAQVALHYPIEPFTM